MLFYGEDLVDEMNPMLRALNTVSEAYPYAIPKNMESENDMMDFGDQKDQLIFDANDGSINKMWHQKPDLDSNLVTLSTWQDVKGKVFTGRFYFLNYHIEGKIPTGFVNLSLPFPYDNIHFNLMFK